MKEIQRIVAALEQLKSPNQAALATLVKVEGSTYRRPGARMLIHADGAIAGAISGGCLESDVVEKAQAVISTGKPRLVKYDTTSEEDVVWGLGLGCQGIAYVLIELITEALNPISFIHKCLEARCWGAIATVFRIEGDSKARLGDRLLLSTDTFVNSIGDRELAAQVLSDTQTALQDKTSQAKRYCVEGAIEVFIEVIPPPLSLIICGAGYDVLPVVHLAKQLGWRVTVVDIRQRKASRQRFQEADRVLLCSPEEIRKIASGDRTVAVVMTHNYLDDLEWLKVLLPAPLKYLGLLGPKKRTTRLLQELQLEGLALTRQHLYSPVGLDIGADNAEEIALAIIAEIQAVTAQRPGGFLRDRAVPIHEQSKR